MKIARTRSPSVTRSCGPGHVPLKPSASIGSLERVDAVHDLVDGQVEDLGVAVEPWSRGAGCRSPAPAATRRPGSGRRPPWPRRRGPSRRRGRSGPLTRRRSVIMARPTRTGRMRHLRKALRVRAAMVAGGAGRATATARRWPARTRRGGSRDDAATARQERRRGSGGRDVVVMVSSGMNDILDCGDRSSAVTGGPFLGADVTAALLRSGRWMTAESAATEDRVTRRSAVDGARRGSPCDRRRARLDDVLQAHRRPRPAARRRPVRRARHRAPGRHASSASSRAASTRETRARIGATAARATACSACIIREDRTIRSQT